MPPRRKGSSNPDGYDDPDWYEKPGETVLMNYRPNPSAFTVPAVPWQSDKWQDARPTYNAEVSGYTARGAYTCTVCGRETRSAEHMTCDYCARAQQRYEDASTRKGQAA